MILVALTVGLLLHSCAAVTSAVTGQPPETVPVSRTTGAGPSFEVAASDVYAAEAQPGKTWGLYDLGFARRVIGAK